MILAELHTVINNLLYHQRESEVPQENRHLVVSCYFGRAPAALHPAPEQVKAIFIANDAALEAQARQKGWDFILVDQARFPVADDLRVSSIQSKYVKFFQFLHDYPEYHRFDRFTYYDHKVAMEDCHLLWLYTRMERTKSLMIRSSPTRKGIREEIEIASRQPRYAQTMPATVRWVDKLCKNGLLNEFAQVANTGIIHCTDMALLNPLFDEVYAQIEKQQQPECQIIWVALAQKYAHHIQQIEWFDLNVPWIVPK
ncbi:hypothetical protein E0K89_020770 [Aquicoccus sp. SCR17]|nr:hypothetical protein [Carideicomes alvinocaridis]